MTTTVVDTSALLALLYDDDVHNDRSSDLLARAASEGKLVINGVVYAELAADATFESSGNLEHFLTDLGIRVDRPTELALFRAGEAFQTYLERRGEELECPRCGNETTFDCPACGTQITARQHLASDFVIGAHAADVGRLLTFDAGFHRDYLDVDVFGPDGHVN